MTLIVGGKYQGKLEFARSISPDASVIDMMKDEKPVSPKGGIWTGFNEWFRRDPEAAAEKSKAVFTENSDAILITEEVGSGVVPLLEEDRRYRESLGRTVNILAGRADRVYRVFAGIPERIK